MLLLVCAFFFYQQNILCSNLIWEAVIDVSEARILDLFATLSYLSVKQKNPVIKAGLEWQICLTLTGSQNTFLLIFNIVLKNQCRLSSFKTAKFSPYQCLASGYSRINHYVPRKLYVINDVWRNLRKAKGVLICFVCFNVFCNAELKSWILAEILLLDFVYFGWFTALHSES